MESIYASAHTEDFEALYDALFLKEYGFYRLVISNVVRKYLECGDLRQGFDRIKCPDCLNEYLLAFSCRGRYFAHLAIVEKWFSFVITITYLPLVIIFFWIILLYTMFADTMGEFGF